LELVTPPLDGTILPGKNLIHMSYGLAMTERALYADSEIHTLYLSLTWNVSF